MADNLPLQVMRLTNEVDEIAGRWKRSPNSKASSWFFWRVSRYDSGSYYESSRKKSTQRSGSLREGHVQAAPRLNDSKMKCERRLSGEEATYRVYSDALEITVCAACADEARKLGIGVEPLSRE